MTITIEGELDMIKGRKRPIPPQPPTGPAGGPIAVPAPTPSETPASPPPAPAAAPVDVVAPDPFAYPDDGLPAPEVNLPPLPASDAGTWDVMTAAWQNETVRTDVGNYAHDLRSSIVYDMFNALPPAVGRDLYSRWNAQAGTSGFRGFAAFEAAVLSAVAQEVPRDPGKWGEYPLDSAALTTRVNERRRAVIDDTDAILDQPGGGIAEFIGASGRAIIDPVNIAMMPFGAGAGGAMRIIATEAFLGGVAEAATLPREFAVAEELGLAEPQIIDRIVMGAAVSGGLTGGILGLVAGAKRFMARNASTQAAVLPGDDALTAEQMIAGAEAAMRGEETVQDVIGQNPPTTGRVDTTGLISPSATNTPGLRYNEDAVLAEIIGVESGGVATAQNPNSSARGLGQFIGSTWLATVRRHRTDLLAGRTENEILALRDDPALSIEMTRAILRDNQAALAAAGIDPGPGEMYLAHFAGSGGAVAIMRATPDTPIAGILGRRVIAANASIRFNGKRFAEFTAGDLRAWAQNKMRRAYDPSTARDMPVFPEGGTSRSYTGNGQIRVGDEFTIDVDYEVVDASTLIRASGNLQPRDRSRIASDAWIADTAARLDPAQLMPSPTADRGTPIVGPDNIIESGNGRFGAITRAYERVPDRAQAYRSAIEAAGYAIPEGVTQPVLVARRTSTISDADRPRLTVAAQDSGVAQMTPMELARATAQTLNPATLSRLDGAAPLASDANGDFVRAALSNIPRSARNAMFDDGGLLNAYGQRQLREALFARAWPDPDLIKRYTEGGDPDLKSLMEALDAASPQWAALRADIEAGVVAPEMDISGHVMDAMRMIASARQLARTNKTPVAQVMSDLLDAVDMIEGPVAPLTVALVRKFWPNGRAASADDVTQFLQRYAVDARKAGASGGLFDAPAPRDVLMAIDKPAFGNLPDDMGPVRGFATPATKPAPAPLDKGFDTGADAPEAVAADAEIVAGLTAPDAVIDTAAPGSMRMPDDLPAADPEIAALRAQAGDLPAAFMTMQVDMPDGTRGSMADLLDDIDTDTGFDAFIQACGIGNSLGGGGAGAPT